MIPPNYPIPNASDEKCIGTLRKMIKTEETMQHTRLFGLPVPQKINTRRRMQFVRPALVKLGEV